MKHRSDNSPRRRRRIVTTAVAIIAAAAIAAGVSLYNLHDKPVEHSGPLPVHLPPTPQSYLGVYADGAPASSAGVTAFTSATGAKPDVLMYYSGWYEPFHAGFATTAAKNGAVPLVQMDPDGVSVAAIAAGTVRRLSERLRRGRPRLPSPRHPELRPRDERQLVRLGLPAHVPHGVRGRLAAHRHRLPGAGSQERDLAVDGQHRQRHPERQDPSPGPVVARQLVCHLGGDRRLLPQARPGSSLPCSGRPSPPCAR